MNNTLAHSFTNGYTSLLISFPLQTFAEALFIPITPLASSKPFCFVALISSLKAFIDCLLFFSLHLFHFPYSLFFFLYFFFSSLQICKKSLVKLFWRFLSAAAES